MKVVLATMVLLTSLMAHALESVNPKFSYPAAEKAFAIATAPTAPGLIGEWMNIGAVSYAGQDQSQSGYWPNGQTTIDGLAGHFYFFYTIGQQTDAFGNVGLILKTETVGVESGKTYDTSTIAGALQTSGAMFVDGGTSQACATVNECRMVNSQNMLLCGATVTEKSARCKKYPTDKVSIFNAFVRKP